jgi:hypothetical protein
MKHSTQKDILTKEDIKFLPTLAAFLRERKGIVNAVKNRQIMAMFPMVFSGISRSRLTAMIHEIRVRKMVKNLIGSPNGFYITRDKTRVKEYVETLHGHVETRKASIQSFGDDPGKGLKKRYKTKGYTTKTGKKVRGYYRTYPGFKNAEQLTVDFTAQAPPKNKKNKNVGQLKMF